jgi:transcriptional regulator with XRE-family HTH domain
MTPPHPAFSNLGLALQVVRHFSGQSQAKLAKKAGFGKSQLSKYENGKELPKLESLGRLLEAFGMSPLAFFTVVDILDGIGQKESMAAACLVRGKLEPVMTSEEQDGIHGIVREVLSLFEAQIVARVKMAAETLARDRAV